MSATIESPEVKHEGNNAGGTVLSAALEKKKRKKSSAAGKKRSAEYPRMLDSEGKPAKLASSETPNFDVSVHATLKSTDFAKEEDFLKWKVWYYQQKQAAAQGELDTYLSGGDTPEQRALAVAISRRLTSGQKDIEAAAASGLALPSAVLAKIEAMYLAAKAAAGQQ